MEQKAVGKMKKPVFLIIIVCVILIALLIVFWPSDESVGDGGYWFNSIETTSPTEAKIEFGNDFFTGPFKSDEILMRLKSDIQQAEFIFTEDHNSNCTIVESSNSNVTVVLVDHYPAGYELNTGDYLEISGLIPGEEYTIELIWLPDNLSILINGQDCFEMPPAV